MPLFGFSYEPRKKLHLLIPAILALAPIIGFVLNGQFGGISQAQQYTPSDEILFSFVSMLVATLSLAIFRLSITAYRTLGSKQVYYLSSAFLVFGLTSLIRGLANQSVISATNSVILNQIISSILFALAIWRKGRDEERLRNRNILLAVLFSILIVFGVISGAVQSRAALTGSFPLAAASAIVSIPLLGVSAFYFLRGFYRAPAAKVLLAFGLGSLLMIDRSVSFLFPERTLAWWGFSFLLVVSLAAMMWSFTTLFQAGDMIRMKSLFAIVFGLEGFVAGGIVLVSWTLGVAGFLTLYGATIPVAPLTSISAILLAVGITMYIRGTMRHAFYFSSTVLTIGLLGLMGVSLGLDPFAIVNGVFSNVVIAPRMAINTASGFILSSAAILTLAFKKSMKYKNLAFILAAFSMTTSIATLTGYFLSVQQLYQWTSISVPMAPVTAWLISFTSLSILLGSRLSDGKVTQIALEQVPYTRKGLFERN